MVTAVMPTYARVDLSFESGEGLYLRSTDGRRFLDFGSGVAVTALGHCHPRMVKAMQEQAAKLWHTSNLYRVPGQERIADKLVKETFADTVFFCNSGAEAMEGVIKICRKYQRATGHPERYRIIVADGAFHGRTITTLSAGSSEKHLAGFEPAMDGFDHVPYNNLNALRDAIGPHTAAILVEPVQGEGGVNPASADYLKGLRAAADEFGLLLAFDEVQTGMGRTGHLFAHQAYGVEPDVIGVAKGFGGGFPTGCVMATEKAAVGMTPGTHGSTFGGQMLATAAAETVLDVMLEPGFMPHVREMAKLLWDEAGKLIAECPQVFSERRGMGLLVGLKVKAPLTNSEVNAKLIDNGLLTVVAGDNVVRLLPALIVEPKHIEEAMAILRKTAASLSKPS